MSSKKPEKTFGEKLREAREAKRLSQARLAREIGVSRHSVNHYESGYSLPESPEIVKKIAEIVGEDFTVDVVRERNEAWYRRKK
jgi:transcriptional regulator with XRE-family HTH domain